MNQVAQRSPASSPRYETEHFLSVFERGPEWLLYDFSPLAGLFRFIGMSESDLMESVFLDHRVRCSSNEDVWTPVPFSAIPQTGQSAPVGFLFHTSFCGSTLFANALSRPGGIMSLREPLVLARIAGLGGGNGAERLPSTPLLVRCALSCLRRPLPGYQATLIKPSNLVHGIADEFMHQTPDARAIVLYQSLESFLISCLKKSSDTRKKMAGLASTAAAQSDRPAVYKRFMQEGKDPLLAAASVFWHVQMHNYQDLLARHPERVAAINFDSAVKDLPASVQRAAGYLFPQLDAIEQSLNLKQLKRNAKQPGSSYSPEKRELERQQILAGQGHRIAKARNAAEALMMDGRVGGSW